MVVGGRNSASACPSLRSIDVRQRFPLPFDVICRRRIIAIGGPTKQSQAMLPQLHFLRPALWHDLIRTVMANRSAQL
eukprot:7012010-Alexandrium_andersonii.AAC.1